MYWEGRISSCVAPPGPGSASADAAPLRAAPVPLVVSHRKVSTQATAKERAKTDHLSRTEAIAVANRQRLPAMKRTLPCLVIGKRCRLFPLALTPPHRPV